MGAGSLEKAKSKEPEEKERFIEKPVDEPATYWSDGDCLSQCLNGRQVVKRIVSTRH